MMSLEKKGCSRLSCSLFLPTNNAEEETRLLPLESHLGQREERAQSRVPSAAEGDKVPAPRPRADSAKHPFHQLPFRRRVVSPSRKEGFEPCVVAVVLHSSVPLDVLALDFV